MLLLVSIILKVTSTLSEILETLELDTNIKALLSSSSSLTYVLNIGFEGSIIFIPSTAISCTILPL